VVRRDPIHVLPYRGYGTHERVLLRGRVLQDEPVGAAGEKDSVWRNLATPGKRIESDGVPFARLAARFGDWSGEVTADQEGHLSSLTISRDRRAVSSRITPPPELVFALFRHHLDTQPPQTRAAGVKGEAA
jgi:hypothetical protein